MLDKVVQFVGDNLDIAIRSQYNGNRSRRVKAEKMSGADFVNDIALIL